MKVRWQNLMSLHWVFRPKMTNLETNEAKEETAERLRQTELLRMGRVDLDRVNTFHDLKQGPGCTVTEIERRANSLVQMQLIETHIVRQRSPG